MVFNDDFPIIPDKQKQWLAFQRRTGIVNTPADFSLVVLGIKRFLLPVYEALIKKVPFTGRWHKVMEIWVV
jgi:hypothetical protein